MNVKLYQQIQYQTQKSWMIYLSYVIWRGCDSRSSRYSIDFCQRLCQLVQLTVKVASLVLILAVKCQPQLWPFITSFFLAGSR